MATGEVPHETTYNTIQPTSLSLRSQKLTFLSELFYTLRYVTHTSRDGRALIL